MEEKPIVIIRDYLLKQLVEFTKNHKKIHDIDTLYKLTMCYDELRYEECDIKQELLDCDENG